MSIVLYKEIVSPKEEGKKTVKKVLWKGVSSLVDVLLGQTYSLIEKAGK